MAPGESVTALNDDRNWRLNWFRNDGFRSPMCGVSGMLGLSFVETLSTLMMTGLGFVGPFRSFVQAISSSGNSVLTSAIIVCAYSTKTKKINFDALYLSLACHIVYLNLIRQFRYSNPMSHMYSTCVTRACVSAYLCKYITLCRINIINILLSSQYRMFIFPFQVRQYTCVGRYHGCR